MKQQLLKDIQQDICNLSKKMQKGYKVGKLKFKKTVQSIPLKQYNNTYKIQRPNRIKIQGLKRWLRVRGLAQIPEGADLANAKLLWKNGDFYLHVTTYIENKPQQVPRKAIGIDFGIKQQLTLSTGIHIKYSITIPPKIQSLARKLAKKQNGSQNYIKTKLKLQKEYELWTNRKKDVIRKLAALLTNHYQFICFQEDPIANWQRVWGRCILNTNIGALLTHFAQKSVTPCVVNQWVATTKRCSHCKYILEEQLELSERTFSCPNCSFTTDRDWNASKCIEELGLDLNHYSHLINELGAERIEVTPWETSTATRMTADFIAKLNQIPFIRASAVNEEGSPPT
jgi:transposase